MPVQIGEINSEVVVDSTRGSGGESAEPPSAPPSPQDEQRLAGAGASHPPVGGAHGRLGF